MKTLKGFENEFSHQVQNFCEVVKERSAQTGEPLDFSEHLRSVILRFQIKTQLLTNPTEDGF